ncbi:Leucine-Rich Repeat-Containing Protein 37A2 [Manis pentadactyla]|nr:Leucine-Rich Repeat-Containing Protein 37A2 [Manis pentadactyla]
MKALQSRKKSSSPELTIEPEKAAADKNAISLSGFQNEQGDFSKESALSYVLSYFSGYMEGAESALLQFIKPLLSNLQGDEPVGPLQNNAENTSLPPGSSISTEKNKQKIISVLEDIIDAMPLRSKLLNPRFHHQISTKTLETAQLKENSPPEIQRVGWRLGPLKVVIKGPKGIRKRRRRQMRKAGINRKQRAQLLAESTAEKKGLTTASPRAPEQPYVAQPPRETAGSSFSTESSFRREQEAAVPSVQYLMGRPPASNTPKSLPEIKPKSKDLADSIFVLEAASARMRNMKASEPTSHLREKYLFPESLRHAGHKILKAKMSRQFSNKDLFSLLDPSPKLTKETQREHNNVDTDLPSTTTAFPFPGSSSPGGHRKAQLNEQLRSLITNTDVKRLISHVFWNLKMGCSETHLKPACAKLIFQTGLLMKLLSEQQEAKEPRADWDTDQWETENYIHGSPEAQSEQEEQEIHEFPKVLVHGYRIKVILALSVTGAVLLLIAAFCLIKMCSRRKAVLDEEGGSGGFLAHLDKLSEEGKNQKGFSWRRRLWLRNMYRTVSPSREKNLAQKLLETDGGELSEVVIEKNVTSGLGAEGRRLKPKIPPQREPQPAPGHLQRF